MISAFSQYHPIVNMAYFISVIAFGMLILHPVFLTIALLSALSYNFILKGFKAIKTFLMFSLPMLVSVGLINTLFNHYGVTVLYTFHSGNNLTLESIIYGLVIGVMVVTVMLWFSCYNEVVTADKFMLIFGKKIPAIALIISMSLRFVPLYQNRLKRISETQKAIGKGINDGHLLDRIKNGCRMLSILITWSLENAVETSNSMRSRGYGLKGRTTYNRHTYLKTDFLILALIVVLDVILIIGKCGGFMEASYNPVITFGTVNAQMIALSAIYLMLCLMPVILEIKEDIMWHRLKLKI
ncbi:Energy-coupling factor transporter transmembrane protein EcfT [bioreactor metagenome]|uniref:Energy-coupling factor transporter transmembrane protein EcfT n=1 Tax=bioreactor metagenome TaxID=1076179 RepID=A0A645DU86_9ZZZZ